MSFEIFFDGASLTIERLGALCERSLGPSDEPRRVELAKEALERVRAARALVKGILERGAPCYGVNTGFGKLCDRRIDDADLEKLQENLIVSHAAGVGAPLPPEAVRAMLAIKVNSLLVGCSGVAESLVRFLAAMLAHDCLPVVPEKGSVGSSGDLAPLSHLGMAILGRGRAVFRGEEMDAAEALGRAGLKPRPFKPKEGLALINGTQLMSGCGAWTVHRARRLAKSADVVAAMSIDSLAVSDSPFDERLARSRPHPGHQKVAANVRRLLAGTELIASRRHPKAVQDPYSLRCVPQVHGACRDAIEHAAQAIEREINSATDNPLIFEGPDGFGESVSGGNFHGEPLALPLDYLAIGVAELASVSERRCALLLEGRGNLPRFLLPDERLGLNSGYMIPQYTAAALVSENKVLCHPASVDTIPTSLGQEDHNSMGSIAATKAMRVLENAETVLAIEATLAAQALDLAARTNDPRESRRRGAGPEAALKRLRLDIPFADEDRYFLADIEKSLEILRSGDLARLAEE